jgi:hypothetical protein
MYIQNMFNYQINTLPSIICWSKYNVYKAQTIPSLLLYASHPISLYVLSSIIPTNGGNDHWISSSTFNVSMWPTNKNFE